jgi:sugar lactone lactonase YvrE
MGVIQVIAPDGKSVVSQLDAGGKNPTNLCFSPGGQTLYVTETQSKAIYALDIREL